MYPTFSYGQIVLVQKKWFFCKFRKGDVIVFKKSQSSLLLIKRIKKIEKNKLFLLGDNKLESADSRMFGWINKKNAIGKVISS